MAVGPIIPIVRTAPDGSTFRLIDATAHDQCMGCGSRPQANEHRLIGIEVDSAELPDGMTATMAMCPRCVLIGLSARMAQRHVADGGSLDDVTDELQATRPRCGLPADDATPPSPCIFQPGHDGTCCPF